MSEQLERKMKFTGLIFFSSRRRHTRSLCDWSSDVCSSDLGRLLLTSRQDPNAASCSAFLGAGHHPVTPRSLFQKSLNRFRANSYAVARHENSERKCQSDLHQ